MAETVAPLQGAGALDPSGQAAVSDCLALHSCFGPRTAEDLADGLFGLLMTSTFEKDLGTMQSLSILVYPTGTLRGPKTATQSRSLLRRTVYSGINAPRSLRDAPGGCDRLN